MNYFSNTRLQKAINCLFRPYFAFFGKLTRILVILGLVASAASCTEAASGIDAAATPAEHIYRMDFKIRLDPSAGGAFVTLTVSQPRRFLRKIVMQADPLFFSQFDGDGGVQVEDGQITWEPATNGGQLKWFAKIDHHRDGDLYDAYINHDWSIFRGDDVIPAATTRAIKGARSDTFLSFQMPSGWSALTEYAKRKNIYQVTNPERRFVTPTGWMLAGKIGTRTAAIAGIRVTVGAPMHQSVRRLDLMAFLNWTLPEVLRLLPDFPSRLTIVSAREPMWRGGLSARQSFFLHGDRPLISENGSSAPLHEIMHVGLGIKAAAGADWIVEGLAEYYSIEILRRTGTLGKSRHQRTMQQVEEWSRSAKSVQQNRIGGAEMARSVMIFKELDDEIRKKTKQRHSLDDVARELAGSNQLVSLDGLSAIVSRMTGEKSPTLDPSNLRGQKK
jgi:hypothetical protein